MRTMWTWATALSMLFLGAALVVDGRTALALGSAKPALTVSGKFADRLPGTAPVAPVRR